MKKIVVGIGEVLWDIFPDKIKLGGAPANFAFHSSEMGLNGFVISTIGSDVHGDKILSELQSKSLNHIIEKVSYPTGTVLVKVDKDGVPEYEICENVAWDNIPFTYEMEELAKRTDAVCFGSLAQRSPISRETINRFIDAVPTHAFKIFDVNLRQHFYTKQIIEDSLHKSNVLKINESEKEILSSMFEYVESDELSFITKLMDNYQLKIVILTNGDKGSSVFTNEKHFYCETLKVEVIDTVGAGDSFTAAFISSLLSGETIEKSHQFAVNVSAFVCTQLGAMAKLPDYYRLKL